MNFRNASAQIIFGVWLCETLLMATPLAAQSFNATAHPVIWQGNPNEGGLAGTTVKLRFEMTNTKLNALQFLEP